MPEFPERVGRYDLLWPVGSGGMATVYLARAHGAGGFEREVALKLVHPHLPDQSTWARDLLEEAKLVARIRHPNVVDVLDVCEDPERFYLVMDYIEGDSLWVLMRVAARAGKALPSAIALRILCDALAGLHAAHELTDADGTPVGLVHRDFSPQNILVGVDGVSRLVDFGVAKVQSRISATERGVIKGKIGYLAPEQARGRALDRRCDVFAAGVVGWELFAGQRLQMPGEDQMAAMLRIATTDAPRLRSIAADIPQAVDDAVAYALQRDPEQRCPTADALRKALLDAWGGRSACADPAEVGEYVRGASGQKLADRRARIAASRRDLTERRDPASPVSNSHAAAVSGAISSAPSAVPDSIDESSLATGTTRATASVVEPPARHVHPRWWRAVLAAAVLTAVAVGAAWAMLTRATLPAPGLVLSESQQPTAPALEASSAPASVASAPAEPAHSVVISGNLPIKLVRVGDRRIAISPAASTATVELRAGERDLPIQATSIDGKTVSAGVSADQARVVFPLQAAPGAAKSGGKPPPLAPSPYEKKP